MKETLSEFRDGYLPLYWVAATGDLYVDIDHSDEEALYVASLRSGVGSVHVDGDRGQVGPDNAQIVQFHRVGPKVLLIEHNLNFRAGSGDAQHQPFGEDEQARRAVAESFAPSVLASFPVVDENAGHLLAKVTDFATADACQIAKNLSGSAPDSYHLDSTRSAVRWESTKGLSRNSVIDATLTFAGIGNSEMSGLAANSRAVTIQQEESFIQPPEPGFEMREADPRCDYFTIAFDDLTQPLGHSIRRRVITRHRLRTNSETVSRPKITPIIYYIDPAIPDEFRDAVLRGANWWRKAFEAAGYPDGFQVKPLPPGADLMDIQYNVVEWEMREDRGWSIGQSIVDPRTGEIIKGHVLLDARRVRYDYRLLEGLMSPYKAGASTSAIREFALSRLSNLVAHEIGHTLGLAHNFHASAQGRSSVMDYPQPVINLNSDGTFDLSHAYTDGVGSWDVTAIKYGYQEFDTPADEKTALDTILAEARKAGLTAFSDQDASAGIHPEVSRWDGGADAANELNRMMVVRRAALRNFGENAIQPGTPLATLEEALAPVYMYHQYQARATAAAIGGERYTFALRGDGQTPVTPVPAAEQERALTALLQTLKPSELALPRPILNLIPVRPTGYDADDQIFPRYTGAAFDAFTPPAVAADFVISLLLDPERDGRIVEQHALEPALPGLEAVVDRIVGTVDPTVVDKKTGYEAEISRLSRRLLVSHLMELSDKAPMQQVRAIATAKLQLLLRRVTARVSPKSLDEAETADRALLEADIRRFLTRQAPITTSIPDLLPPNSTGLPLGNGDSSD